MHRYLFPFLSLLLVFGSCLNTDDTCSGQLDNGNFQLSSEAEAYYPYAPGVRRVIFADSLGNEYPFSLLDNELQRRALSATGPCPEDNSQTAIFISEFDYYRLRLVGETLTTEFQLWLIDKVPQPNPEGISGEELYIQSLAPGLEETVLYYPINQVDGMGDPVSAAAHARVLDSLTLIGRAFEDVIVDDGSPLVPAEPRFRVYYNTEVGLLGFFDSVEGRTYVYERVEE